MPAICEILPAIVAIECTAEIRAHYNALDAIHTAILERAIPTQNEIKPEHAYSPRREFVRFCLVGELNRGVGIVKFIAMVGSGALLFDGSHCQKD